ncbi:MAG: hypothetical protein H7Y04_14925 [Verrucomicrobia bacterium]|nr:hypothetical protein [Cytophagales bacterium]
MKKLFGIISFVVCTQAWCQDFVLKKDGNTVQGKAQSFENNLLIFKNTDNQILKLKSEDLKKIHFADNAFKMKHIRIENADFDMGENGITITFDGAEIEEKLSNPSENNKTKELKSKEEIQIISDDNTEKTSIVFQCSTCLNEGKLQMQSLDGKSKAKWTFSTDGHESNFPHKMDIDANKTYNWSYYDTNMGLIKGTFKAEKGKILTIKLEPK